MQVAQKAWPGCQEDPSKSFFTTARFLFTLQRSDMMAETLPQTLWISWFDAILNLLSMYMMAFAQLFAVPLVILTVLSARNLSPILATVAAISPTPCLDVPSDMMKPRFDTISSPILLSQYTARRLWLCVTQATSGRVHYWALFLSEIFSSTILTSLPI